VRSLHGAVKAAVEAGAKLEHELRLAQGAAVIDRRVRVMPQPAPPPPPAPREAYHADAFNATQLRALGRMLRAAAAGNMLPVPQLAVLLARAAAAAAETRIVPPAWAARGPAELAAVAARFDNGVGFADVRRVLLELAALPPPPADALPAAAAALGEVAPAAAVQAHAWGFAPTPAPGAFDEGAAMRDALCGTCLELTI
jgi:hypothetical protein